MLKVTIKFFFARDELVQLFDHDGFVESNVNVKLFLLKLSQLQEKE